MFTLETTDGEYRCRNLVLAVGIAEPWSPAIAGHRARPPLRADPRRRVVRRQAAVHHRQAELRVRARVGPGVHGRRRSRCRRRRPPRRRSRPSRWSASAPATSSRSRTTSSGSGCRILDASIDGIEPIGDAFRVNLKRTDNGEAMSVEADEVIAATGFTCPLLDLADLGVTTFGQAKLPSVTPMWESATVPGIFFAGTISSAAPGPQEARHPVLLRRRPGAPVQRAGPRPAHRRDAVRRRDGAAARSPPSDVLPYLLREATCAPELWHQKAYLGRVLSVSADDGIRDEGILPRRPRARRDDRRTWSR